ncbi:MAG: M6 family metalloprotease domain-containing protein [Prevotellaceae bacterium]|jgi:M6 family metalloprotease-like protein|nr:M6 family metalloprotease domain-containing protein [Prevotellaceae bacterium]
MKKLLICITLTFSVNIIFAAYLTKVPVSITQPNGTTIECFATGDEYYNWIHDANNYTIVQDTVTGYFCYAVINNGNMDASPFIVGVDNPATKGLTPGVNLSTQQIQLKVASAYKAMHSQETKNIPFKAANTTTPQVLNNIVIYIRFADQDEFPENQATYTDWFNTGATSMRNYFLEASYNQLEINSSFYPLNNGTTILSYQDANVRDYYCPYNSIANPLGYNMNDYNERMRREHTLLCNAVEYVKNQIPSSLNLDANNNGYVDNICFIIRGNDTGNNTAGGTLLWAHKSIFFNTQCPSINGKGVSDYNVQIESMLPYRTGILSHEMGHSLGMPDLYHYYDNAIPVGYWDLMASDLNPPQHMGAYMKHKYTQWYGRWIQEIPTITTSGRYTLNPLTSPINNCYRIQINKNNNINSSKEGIILEYRKREGLFEYSLPGSGLIIYRITEDGRQGNANGSGHYGTNGDAIFVFRPGIAYNYGGRINDAHFSDLVGRTEFHLGTDPLPYSSSNVAMNVYIENIQENIQDNTISFDVRFCDGNTIIHSNTNNLPTQTKALDKIETNGTVVVKNSDNIIFEAGNEVLLEAGFEVQSGGIFEINMKGCGTLY